MKKLTFISAAAVLLFAPVIYGETITVDQDPLSPGFSSIQAAIDYAGDGDEIEVRLGTYNETIDFKGKAITLHSVDGLGAAVINGNGAYHVVLCVSGEDANSILEGFTITGGNARGSGSNAWGGGMYNYNSSPTVINCFFTLNRGGYGAAMLNNNSSPIVTACTFSSNTATTYAGGIENYNGSAGSIANCLFEGNSSKYGAGMLNNNSSPIVTGCTFTGNAATIYGGGMENLANSGPTVADCTFTENTAGTNGGGIYNTSSSPTIIDCSLSGNSASGNGGGMFSDAGKPEVINCIFSGNTAGGSGGGMRNWICSPNVTGCTFTENTASHSGGGMINANNSSPNVTNCIFIGNSTGTQDGGGMENDDNSNPTVVNCVFVSNYAADVGGGMCAISSSPKVTNCTFGGNSAGRAAGGIRSYSSSEIVTNCIIWGNTAPSYPQIYGGGTFKYSNIQGGWNDTGNISVDPLFIDVANGDLRLRSCSVCVDAGNNAAVPSDTADLDNDGDTAEPTPLDLDGNPRFVDDPRIADTGAGTPPIVDMGAYEQRADSTCLEPVYVYNRTQDTSYIRIQAAIDDANDGDEIEVAAITSCEAIDFKGKAIHLYSTAGPNSTTIDATGLNTSAVTCKSGEDANTIIEGFTITGGNASGAWPYNNGGGMFNSGSSPTVTNCIFRRNTAAVDGGGMYNRSGSPTVSDCVFSGNTAVYGGGMLNNASSPNITNCIFGANTAGTRGGGMENYNNSNSRVSNCTFSDNSAAADGGGMYNHSGSNPTITGCTFSGNSANWGGGMYSYQNCNPMVTNCTFSDNSAGVGGGGMLSWSNPTVSNCIFSGNTTLSGTYGGGGMINWEGSHPVLENCTFTCNEASYCGGGLYNYKSASVTLTDCNFVSNSAGHSGGGVVNNTSPSPIFTNCTFSTNEVGIGSGGGIYNYYSASPKLTNCTFSGNHAVILGGGVYNYYSGNFTATDCNFISNSANSHGGGLCNDNSASPTLTRCNFISNSAGNYGGGIHSHGSGSQVLTNCTFSDNDADFAGGMSNYYGSDHNLTDCMFKNNEAGNIGGAMYNDSSNATITGCEFLDNSSLRNDTGAIMSVSTTSRLVNCVFRGNTAPDKAGAIYFLSHDNSTVINCEFSGNSSNFGGGVFTYNAATPSLINCTFSGNSAPNGGGLFNFYFCNVTVTNCIFWDNTLNEIENIDRSSATVSYSNIGGGYPGTNNMNTDPLFVNVTEDDFRLLPESPCVDIGDNSKVPVDILFDPRGNPRIWDGDGDDTYIVDMGAYEYGEIRVHNIAQDENYVTIQAAIEDAADGDEIEVEPGIYNEAINFNGKAVRLYSTDGPEVTIIDANGLNSSVVTCNSGEDADTILDGFTITGGRGTLSHIFWYGGGMYNYGSSPTVKDCIFTANSVADYGSGMYNGANSNPVVANCSFAGNYGESAGGGMCNNQSNPMVTNCTFIGNSGSEGAGMRNSTSSPTVINCTFGGNSAGDNGGGVYNYNSSPTVTNCTFSSNIADANGGGMYNYNSSPTVANCIFWDDAPNEIFNDSGSPSITYCNVQGGWSGTGNIDGDPLFFKPAEGDLRIYSSASPCVDAGDNNSVPSDITDLDGDGDVNEPIPWDLNSDSRIYDGDESGAAVVDMGALEFNGGPVRNVTQDYTYLTIQTAINDANDGDEIQAEPGTYREAIDFKGKAIRLHSTDGPEVTIIDANGVPGAYHVVQCVSGEDENTILEGFAITGGNATGAEPNDRGGGMYNLASSPTVLNCIFTANKANFGGGMFNYEDANPMVVSCVFSKNVGNIGGGCIYNFQSSPTIVNCGFSGNWAGGGGVIYSDNGNPVVINCTFSGNSAYGGGAIYNHESSLTVVNCILWDDMPDEIYNDSGTAAVTYSNVQGGWPGAGNIAVNPRLVDPWNSDFQPRASECVDSGNNSAVPPGVITDIRGEDRFADDPNIPETGSGAAPVVDMGACERQTDDRFRVITVDDDGPADFPTVQDALDNADYGDEIELTPGTYSEVIDFGGKVVRLYSSGGPAVTVINGNGADHVVQCVSGESQGAVLEGFTITGATDSAMLNEGSSPTVINCTFIGNSGSEGAGMRNSISSPTLINCTFGGNSASENGGGMHNYISSPIVVGCMFIGNRTQQLGGGIYNEQSSPSVINSIFISNRAAWEGGAMYDFESYPELTNCTFSKNIASDGGGLYNFASIPTVTNCIFWGDEPEEIYDDDESLTIVNYSDVQGGWFGTGNIDADPLFPLSGEPHLPFGSPCIDAGTNTPPSGLTSGDPDGTGRLLDGDYDGAAKVDMGAYEFNSDPLSPPCMAVWPPAVEFIAYGGQTPEPALLEIQNVGGGSLSWLINADCSWLELNRSGGQSSGGTDNIILDPNISGLDPGEYYCTLTLTDPNAINSPRFVLAVLNLGSVRNVPDAYPTIRSAIGASSDGDIVLVADGIYEEHDLDFGGRTIMLSSENGPYGCIIDCNDEGRGFNFHSGETEESILDGFTILDGNTADYGGGVNIQDCYPTIRNCDLISCESPYGGGIHVRASASIISSCYFINNVAGMDGGGIYNDDSSPTVSNCAFSENWAHRNGAGMYNIESSPTVSDCNFISNAAEADGGGMLNTYDSDPTVTNCTFSGNTASGEGARGGGMYNHYSHPTIFNSSFTANHANTKGGGIFGHYSSLTMTACIFTGNIADSQGGAMRFEYGSPRITNCTFVGNTANDLGGGIVFGGSSSVITNCTFTKNVAVQQGGALWLDAGDSVTNCIIWGNTPFDSQIGNSIDGVTYSCVENGATDKGNIIEDPLFVDTDANDLRLQVMSLCIDKGRNIAGIYSDIRGSVRPISVVGEGNNLINNNFDMGAYEYSRYYSGTEDEHVPAFREVEMPSFCLVGELAEMRWKNHPGFVDDDLRITDPKEYHVNLVLVSEDGTRRLTLNNEPIAVSSTTAAPDIPYTHEYMFGQIHEGRWYLRVELSEDRNQYVESTQTYLIGLRQPKLYEIGQEITPPFDADLEIDPIIEEGREDYFYWSEYARKLYAVGPIAAVVEWTDMSGDPLPLLVGNVWPREIQIHVADSPDVDLLSEAGTLTFVEVRYADNDAAVNSSLFSATSEGHSVLMYGDNTNYEFVPEFEVVRTVLWNNPEFLEESEWPIGTEVNEPKHDEKCGSGHVYQEISPYDADIYDRDTRSGRIFAVNLDDPCSVADDLIVFWYEKGKFGADWPYLQMRYYPKWPSTPEDGLEKIVIASCLGSEIYDQNSLNGSHRNMQIYNQPDPALPGCNPNEEHAAFFPSNLGSSYQAVYALRNDLNRTDWNAPNNDYTSEPYVLLKYQDIYDSWHYRVFKVLIEEGGYDLRYAAEAGMLMQPPYPMTRLLPGCDGVSYPDLPGPWWVDYNGKIWARHAADTEPGVIRWFYQLQPGFWYDLNDDGVQDEPVGTCVPWLNHRSEMPIAVAYDLSWPSNVPELQVGETLMKPKRGLPEISNQCSVKIIFDEPNEVHETTGAAKLIKPLSEHRVDLLGLPSEIKVLNKGGVQVFDDLPFHLRTRSYYDPLDHELVFKGYFDDTVVGEPILLLNVISDRERDELLNLDGEGDTGSEWDGAVKALYEQTQEALEQNETRLGAGTKALSAGTAGGTGYVTLAFAGDPTCSPLPVSVEVIKVVCGPYRGELKVIESDNVFDERITFRHSGDFGGKPEGRLFEWRYSYSLDEPNEPNEPRPSDDWQVWPVSPVDGNAVLDITVGGAGLVAVQDLWFSCRYYDELCGDWSMWTEPQLHESWLKRVNRQINLFDQRFKDFHESEINTLVSMVGQIGRRYEGDVALTAEPENINSVGMLELYETLFRRAAEFSIDSADAEPDPVADRTLLFATSRIATLYTVLGNEAYADALDPAIGFTTKGADYSIMAPIIHCFQNQTDSLLSEELALLRGVESNPYPQPLYNRLIWNFTSGDGEVAYASNYVITDMDDDGDIDEYDAAIMYPQGHGDAWGHYLMALKTYYKLLVHPNYKWVPQSEHVLVGGTPVEVDYFDERQFAKIATAKAKAGAEIVDLTYRQRHNEDPENQWQGYKDIDPSRAWGVAGWASRAGQGTYFDWVVANAQLSDVDPDPNHTGLQKVDRTTVIEIREIASSFNDIQGKLDMADLGLNPLGVAKDAIPFDINPFELVDAHGQPAGRTHFEQIYDRALTALNNALATFNFANQNTQLLRRQQDSLEDFTYNVAQRELDFRNRQIEIFGYPYDDDIGSAGTYPEGYDGPDIYHYMYADSSELMSSSSPETIEFAVTFEEPLVNPQGALSYESKNVVFHLSPNGLGFIKPASWTGSRRAPGELQMARSNLLQTKANFDRAMLDYNNLLDQIEDQAEILEAQYGMNTSELNILNRTHNTQESLNQAILAARSIQLGFHALGRRAVLVANALAEFLPKSVGFSTDVTAPGRGAIRLAGAVLNEIFTTVADIASIGELGAQQAKERAQSLSNIELTAERQEFAELQQLKQLEQLVRSEASQRLGLFTLAETMQQVSGRYLAALAKGERVYDELTRFRKQTAADIQRYRYNDMTFRVFRNDALQKYRAQFDLAAMYTYLAAKAYDYETALLDDYSEAGQHFLNRIVSQRTIGQIGQTGPIPGDGLAGVLAELKQNFDVLKIMMGFNNPQIETTWFSLRKEHFRITQDTTSNSDWKKAIDEYYVEDLWDLPEFRRYCKPFDTEDVALPGFVIPFQTNITNGLNFFGWPGGADPFYAPENCVTKIRSVGVWFSNYNQSIMSPTPRIYLIPVGQDVMRAEIGEIRSWQVVEQSIPLPFQIEEYELANNFEWIPMNDSVPSPLAEIRRYSRFRAYPDGGFNPSEMTYDSRLVGRSVWNTRWLLIIPGHSLYLSDPWEGMERFIYGAPVLSGDGERTGNGVTDIKLFFKTYAYPGY